MRRTMTASLAVMLLVLALATTAPAQGTPNAIDPPDIIPWDHTQTVYIYNPNHPNYLPPQPISINVPWSDTPPEELAPHRITSQVMITDGTGNAGAELLGRIETGYETLINERYCQPGFVYPVEPYEVQYVRSSQCRLRLDWTDPQTVPTTIYRGSHQMTVTNHDF